MSGIDKSVFYYELPKHLIAQEPLAERTSSRLMVLGRCSGEISHGKFTDIADLVNPGDCLVLNDTKVMPARLIGIKEVPEISPDAPKGRHLPQANVMKTGAKIEILLLKRLGGSEWEVLSKPAKRFREGDTVSFGGGLLKARATGVFDDGIRRVHMEHEGIFEEILDKLGETPLPPYITKKLADRTRYQTVYAAQTGSSAAPTAGLHFTDTLLAKLSEKGVKIAKITLHVGLGTFRPLKENDITAHKMHSEYYHVDEKAATIINEVKRSGGRIICVGTTSVRTLETLADESGFLHSGEDETDIFIYPGYSFKITDALITNFHLPESTLMALVCAFAGTERVLGAYNEAVNEEYRFFSFGDAMFIG